MTCSNPDLTIAGALADPVIAAAMRADRVDPRAFETLLRATARRLDERRRAAALPRAALCDGFRHAFGGSMRAW